MSLDKDIEEFKRILLKARKSIEEDNIENFSKANDEFITHLLMTEHALDKIERYKDKPAERKESSLGSRNNEGKPRWSLLNFKTLEGTIRVFEHGEKEYGPKNWMKGLSHKEIAESGMRHLTAFLDGEDLDQKTGLHHIDHASANMHMLKYMILNKPELDDR